MLDPTTAPKWATAAWNLDALILDALYNYPRWYGSKVVPRLEEDDDCLVWTGALNDNGYGVVALPDYGPIVRVHRVAFLRKHLHIDFGLTLDHACSNRACALPTHLEPTSQIENCRRSDLIGRWAR